MSLFLASLPYRVPCLIRREYVRDLLDGHGGYYGAVAIGVECRRGRMMGFHVVFTGYDEINVPGPVGGAMYRVPILALCDDPCPHPDQDADVAPWDCLSDEFSVERLALLHEMRVHIIRKVLPDGTLERRPARYLFTVQFGRSDLADDPEQGKQLHVVRFDCGWFGCFPNNLMLVEDRAQFVTTKARPDFRCNSHVFSAE